MSDGIKLSPSQISSCADAISAQNVKMNTELENVVAIIESLKNSWSSETAEITYSKIRELKPVIDQYRQEIEQYVAFLKNTISDYQSAEAANKQNITAFQ